MYYYDTQRTKTRRDSSLVIPRKPFESTRIVCTSEHRSLNANPSEADHCLDHGPSILDHRPPGSVRKELVTSMFEAMLDGMITSWNVVSKKKDLTPSYLQLNDSDVGIKKKKHVATASSTRKQSLHVEKIHVHQDPTRIVWWSAPDETAVIHFRNGNKYEGNISKKVMHGEGRYQWADGTIYVGHFENNKMSGRGRIQWKNDSWYEGEFMDSLRHGKGVFVESREQRSYSGDWHMGTKHGKGLMRYSMDPHDSYDGDWAHNVRHGFGYREYSKSSGYGGEWNTSIRDGKGLMIWPTGDFYSGGWINGTMSGFGVYMWDSHWNGSLSMSPVNGYHGNWLNGKRHGCGILKLGPASGEYYQGGFNNNFKHGEGELVNNCGKIYTDEYLFENDNFKCDNSVVRQADDRNFEMFSEILNLDYHVEKAIEHLNESHVRSLIIDNYLKSNSFGRNKISDNVAVGPISGCKKDIEDFVHFEIVQLRRVIHIHTTLLKNIYRTYSTICNEETVHFEPVLVRLYFWQFLFDCNVHQKGFTLVEIDTMFHSNPEWLSKRPHKPFEVINYWQFLNILISLSCKMYAKWEFPGPKPETIVANAFDTFMNDDAKMACGRRKGYLTTEYISKIPLKGMYSVYLRLGEPHTVRDFLRSIRHAAHLIDLTQPKLIDTEEERLPKGRNMFIIADKIIFIKDFTPLKSNNDADGSQDDLNRDSRPENLILFNFGNLSSRTILKKFSEIFPSVWRGGKNINVGVEITFFEFFQVFIACAKESVHVTEEELAWRNKLSLSPAIKFDKKNEKTESRS